MLSRSQSSSVSGGKLFAMYIAAGVASIPFGITYSILSLNGRLTEIEQYALLGAALLSALGVWGYLQRRWSRLATRFDTLEFQPSFNAQSNADAERNWISDPQIELINEPYSRLG